MALVLYTMSQWTVDMQVQTHTHPVISNFFSFFFPSSERYFPSLGFQCWFFSYLGLIPAWQLLLLVRRSSVEMCVKTKRWGVSGQPNYLLWICRLLELIPTSWMHTSTWEMFWKKQEYLTGKIFCWYISKFPSCFRILYNIGRKSGILFIKMVDKNSSYCFLMVFGIGDCCILMISKSSLLSEDTSLCCFLRTC